MLLGFSERRTLVAYGPLARIEGPILNSVTKSSRKPPGDSQNPPGDLETLPGVPQGLYDVSRDSESPGGLLLVDGLSVDEPWTTPLAAEKITVGLLRCRASPKPRYFR